MKILILTAVISLASIAIAYQGTIAQIELNQRDWTNITYQAQKRPNSAEFEAKKGAIREVTAYNVGDITQTDSTPCISANGENICLALEKGYKRCAANFVPLGTELEIQYYGRCLVVDRTNSRYKNRVDIAMRLDEKQRAINFGKQNLLVSIVD